MHRPHSDSLAAAGRTSPPAAHGPLPPAFPRLLLFSVDLNLLGAGAMSLLPPLLSGSVAASPVTTAANHCWPRLLTPDSGAWGGCRGQPRITWALPFSPLMGVSGFRMREDSLSRSVDMNVVDCKPRVSARKTSCWKMFLLALGTPQAKPRNGLIQLQVEKV